MIYQIFLCLYADVPYFVRTPPVTFKTEPCDVSGIYFEILLQGHSLECEATVEPIVSGWSPHIYWYHNGSIVDSIHGINIESNHWNWSHLTTVYPGSYQCVFDDGYFVTVSREAWIFLYSTFVKH